MNKSSYIPVLNAGGKVNPFIVRDKRTGKFISVEKITKIRTEVSK